MKLKVLKFGLRTSLALVFLGLVILHVVKLTKKDVGSKSFRDRVKDGKFPSIAVCPYAYHLQVPLVTKGRNLTLSDAMDLPSIKDTIDVTSMYSGLYSYE